MGTTLGIEAIAEFSVLTNTYSAQFGGNGAVVNALSKSGTNDLHGDVYFGDYNNHRVRRVDAHGTISSVAGTGQPGAVATVDRPLTPA